MTVRPTRRHTKRIAKGFDAMTRVELRTFIDACHAARDYGAMFDQACRLFNTKFLNAEATR